MEEAFSKAETLVVETDITRTDKEAMRVRLKETGTYPTSDALPKHLSPETYRALSAFCQTRGFPIAGFDRLRSPDDLVALRRATIKPWDLDLSAYHPLGTARMGRDPSTSVIGPDHQVHDTPGLYVVDGAAVPSSLGVNPQITIMALATRAAEKIAAALA